MNTFTVRKVLAISLFSLLSSCATNGNYAQSIQDGLKKGQPQLSLAMAESKDASEKKVLASMNKGMLRRMTGDYEGSNQIFEVAKQKIEDAYGTSVTENLASVTINETFRSYKGDRYEQLLLHAYMAMNYIQQDNLDAARVEMLQANVKMMEWGDVPEEDAFIHYIGGMIYESLGEFDNALISYRQAYVVYKKEAGVKTPAPSEALKKDLLHLLVINGLTDEYERYKSEFSFVDSSLTNKSEDKGELIIILNNGLAPIRRQAAINIYSSEVSQNLRIAFPKYNVQKTNLNEARIVIDNTKYNFESVENIDALARYSLSKEMPGIMARATVRAVGKYKTQSKAHEKGGLAEILVTVANIATEKADTRSWITLPQEIQLKRIRLPVGEHNVTIQLMGAAGNVIDELNHSVNIEIEKIHFLIKHWVAKAPKM